MNNPIVISIGGNDYSGWTKAKVSRSIDAMAGSFSMSVAFEGADFINQVVGTREIKKGSECTVSIAGQLVITGSLEKRKSSGSKTRYTLSVEGRSKTKRLIKSSPKGKEIQFNNRKRTDIVKKIASDLGVEVKDKSNDSSKVYRHIMSDGITAGQEIYNVAREAGIQLSDDENGNLVILNPDGDGQGDDIELGVNIEEWTADLSEEDEKKEYQAAGHSVPTDNKYGKDAVNAAVKAIEETFKSPEIRRIRVDSDVDVDTLKKRAALEARRSSAESNSITIKTKDITQKNGKLWSPNTKHRVSIWVDGIDIVMLLKSVEWEFDKGECSVSLTFTKEKGHSNSTSKGAKNQSTKSGSKAGSATGEFWESSELISETDT